MQHVLECGPGAYMDETNLNPLRESGRKSPLQWASRIFGPPPGLKEINLVCWGLFVAFLAIPLCVLLWLQLRTGSASLLKLHPDFIYFYGIGRLVNQYSIDRLYDFGLQLSIFNGLFQLKEGSYGPSPYPPFVAEFFSPFARIPFEFAYLIWAGISIALFLIGITCVVKDAFPGEQQRLKVSLIYCFSLAFYPFIISTVVNGQLSAVAFAAIAFAIYLERRSILFSSGLALSALSYKPTLLLLIIPMLLITRRFRALLGFAVGVVCLMVVSTIIAGTQFWTRYIDFLRQFKQAAGLGQGSSLQLWKYVDFHSLSNSLQMGKTPTGLLILGALTFVIALPLAILLWKSASESQPAQDLAWAATLTWTLLLNVYVPIYDSVLFAIAAILTLCALADLGWHAALRSIVCLAILSFALSWISVGFAKDHQVQLFTLALSVLGVAQLILLRRAIHDPFLTERPRPLPSF